MFYTLLLFIVCLNSLVIEGKVYLSPRHGSHFFIRVNSKVNILPNTAIFAYATGFRLNWNMKIPHVTGFHHHDLIFQKSVERTIDDNGFEGRACLIKAFCDLILIEQYDDIISKLLKVIFKTRYAGTCPQDINCPFSLVTFAYMLYGNNGTIY
ncbi:hypothetical protein O3M35_008619 [Rhynocoris fuscipes]|uniref:Uncharacterized protein n=1 Tax=Rhynocoris fuscipes TaxID=488301 RepID=A0AAW1DCK2_9HEMI